MFRSLRKGRTSVYFQHEHTGHSIGAEKYESKVSESVAVLRFSLKPVDSNQRYDEEYLHSEPLISLSVDDGTVVDGFIKHVDSSDEDISIWKIQIFSKNREFEFTVEPKLSEIHKYRNLTFKVLQGNG
ncbi:hypothetical protein GNX18_07465 [Microbulbifer sp. SH-1]|uniref:hypothetical protein n=1 Tax=Microbulbifer sp. SH-1 TaxID=2681547 RepID=UPI00140A909B|nr:hypothetical protein [Microbulbifer sp. SH-1]QIL89608.1 hypothetical protein GNX18_07465 [Microbulbifer sp. SH-1]